MENHSLKFRSRSESFAMDFLIVGKYLSYKILSGTTVSDAEIYTAYTLLLEELDLSPKVKARNSFSGI
jgi:hypothetical protein